jgi:hypothetical protein
LIVIDEKSANGVGFADARKSHNRADGRRTYRIVFKTGGHVMQSPLL